MVKVEFFGSFRLNFKIAEINIEAKSIKEMLDIISKKFPNVSKQEIYSATLFVNDKEVKSIFRNFMKLKDGDKVLMLYPSSGG